MFRKTFLATTALGGMLALTTALAPAASAADSRNGLCESGEICFYWGDNLSGAVYDSFDIFSDMAGQRFIDGTGAGSGSWLKNNAASIWNNTGVDLCVFYDENFSGPSDLIPKGARVNLGVTKNNNASDRAAYSSGNRCYV